MNKRLDEYIQKRKDDNPEQWEQDRQIADILDTIFEDARDAALTSFCLMALADGISAASLESLFGVGLYAYRQFMLDNGVDVVAMEEKALNK